MYKGFPSFVPVQAGYYEQNENEDANAKCSIEDIWIQVL